MSEAERQRWDRLRRALVNIVTQMREADPEGQYTLDVRIVPREQQVRKTA